MTVSVASFRATFPVFTQEKYPDPAVTMWIGIAERMVGEERWGDLRDHGITLFVAHNLSQGLGLEGGSPSPASPAAGPVSSKSVGELSVSYDTSAGTLDGAGNWNLSTYGVQYAQLARMMGAGIVAL